MLRAAILSGTLIVLSPFAWGFEPAPATPPRDWPSQPRRGEHADAPPCTCRAPATQVEVGREVCLATPSGGRRARCVMVLNNTSWEVTEERCGTSAALFQQAMAESRLTLRSGASH